jgi:2-(1,2-epoxy-1,2-dihydrophenyl)acetyl-CoA isomerase
MILTETRGRVGIVTFNRPEKLNTMHPEMMGEMREQIDAWNVDPGVGAIVLTGAGRAFCAGADIGGWNQDIQAGGAGQASRQASQEEPWIPFAQRSKPLICAINGPAIGAGLTLTFPCDVRIASDKARLSMRFARIGIMPESASSHFLPRIIGIGHAMELMLSGRIIDGAEGARIGLVNRVVPQDQLLDEAVEIAAEIAFNPTESLHGIKRLAWQNLEETDLAVVQQREREESAAAMQRPAFKEAVRSFLEKREPNFHNLE